MAQCKRGRFEPKQELSVATIREHSHPGSLSRPPSGFCAILPPLAFCVFDFLSVTHAFGISETSRRWQTLYCLFLSQARSLALETYSMSLKSRVASRKAHCLAARHCQRLTSFTRFNIQHQETLKKMVIQNKATFTGFATWDDYRYFDWATDLLEICPQLTRFLLSYVFSWPRDMPACPQLRSLCLHCSTVNRHLHERFLVHVAPTLQSLILDGLPCLVSVLTKSGIVDLSVHGEVTRDGLETIGAHLSEMPALAKLNCILQLLNVPPLRSSVTFATQWRLLKLTDFGFTLQSLRNTNGVRCPTVIAPNLVSLRLESVCMEEDLLRGGQGVVDTDFVILVQQCALQSLSLGSCFKESKCVSAALTKAMPHLAPALTSLQTDSGINSCALSAIATCTKMSSLFLGATEMSTSEWLACMSNFPVLEILATSCFSYTAGPGVVPTFVPPLAPVSVGPLSAPASDLVRDLAPTSDLGRDVAPTSDLVRDLAPTSDLGRDLAPTSVSPCKYSFALSLLREVHAPSAIGVSVLVSSKCEQLQRVCLIEPECDLAVLFRACPGIQFLKIVGRYTLSPRVLGVDEKEQETKKEKEKDLKLLALDIATSDGEQNLENWLSWTAATLTSITFAPTVAEFLRLLNRPNLVSKLALLSTMHVRMDLTRTWKRRSPRVGGVGVRDALDALFRAVRLSVFNDLSEIRLPALHTSLISFCRDNTPSMCHVVLSP